MRELKKLRKPRPLHISTTRLLPGTTTLQSKRAKGDTMEIRAKFRARNAEKFGIKVRAGKGERTMIGYDTARARCLCGPDQVRERQFQPLVPERGVRSLEAR